jgi:hypothetical protein
MLNRNNAAVATAGRITRFAAVLVVPSLCAGTSPPPAAVASSGNEVAVWVQREVNFRYVGFTTQYSCDGLRDRMRRILLQLGARDDLRMTGYGCTGVNSPENTPGVRIVMHVLQAASAPAGQTVAAHWKTIDLLADRDLFDAARDCELIAQLNRAVLPLFTVRHVDYSASCSVNTPLVGGTRLKADVLVADAAPPVGATR